MCGYNQILRWFSDCTDGSDENACSVDEDPNRAPACGADCQLPDCYCSADGTVAPGGGKLELNNIPMMITLTFGGAVNGENINIYNKLFDAEALNPNGCTARGTFFVSHKYTNYSAVQELHRVGHEIGVFSITNNEDSKYWTEGSYDNWLGEMAGARLIVEKFANITDGTVVGMRAPYLRVGGNEQFNMMNDQFFLYDSSITAPLSRVPVWPYTLHYRMPHKCHGNAQNCPSRSHRSGRCLSMSLTVEMILSTTRHSPDVTLCLPVPTSMLRNRSDSFCSTTSSVTTARTERRCRCRSTRPG